MQSKTSLATKIFWILATPVALTGFTGLFSRSLKFELLFFPGDIIHALDQYTVYGQTLKGRAAIVRGEHWFFLITIGIVAVMAIIAMIIIKLSGEDSGRKL